MSKSEKTFNAVPGGSSSSYRYKEPWSATMFDQAKLFSIQLVCAGGAGAIAKTSVAPLERIKILLQVQHLSAIPPEARYRGFWDALRRIPVREGGWQAYYRGNGANVLRLVPEVGFKFVMHDQFKIMFAPADGSPLGILEKLAAGAATGVLKTLLFYPLDLCRTRITADTSASTQPRVYSTVRQCLADTLRHEGVRGCYKGVVLSMVSIVPYLSISFTTYDQLRSLLPEDKQSKAQLWYPLLKIGCGSAAAMTAQAVSYPLDTLRRRLQLNGSQGTSVQYRNLLHCVQQMLVTEGPQAFYRGFVVNCCKTLPGAAIQFIAYDALRVGITALDPTAGVTSPL